MNVLTNGLILPNVGLGTAELDKMGVEQAVQFITEACLHGCRLIDTAPVYGTEEIVGLALKNAMEKGVHRKDIIISTKLPNENQGYKGTLRSIEQSLESMYLDYIDIYLIHWPVPKDHEKDFRLLNRESWRAMEEMYRMGKIHAIGVCNFLPRHLESLMEHAVIPPMINQLEIHPFYHETETVLYCQNRKILVEAWGPFYHGKVFQSEILQKIAWKHNVKTNELVLSWLHQRGIVSLPKTMSIDRWDSNKEIKSIPFDEMDVRELSALDNPDEHADYWNYRRQLSC